MYKRPSPVKPIIICSLIMIFIMESIIFSINLPKDDLLFSSIAVLPGSIAFGSVFGSIIYFLFLKPSKSLLLIQKQTELLEKSVNSTIQNGKADKIDKLDKLANLKKSGVISEEEFCKLKKEIVEEK